MYENNFSWSHSRRGMFQECLRKYYLNYYGSWGGWQDGATPETREAWVQKKLTTVPMWIGTVIHDAAEATLTRLLAGREVDPHRVESLVMERAEREVEASASQGWRRNPRRVTIFQEHYYGLPLPEGTVQEALGEIRRQCRRFFTNPVFLRLKQVPGQIMEVEQLEQVEIGGVPVWVRLDALVADGKGGCVVIDWKTGAAHDEGVISEQLGVYGLYCTLRHEVRPEAIIAMHVNLRTGERTQHPVGPDALERARAAVRKSADQMLALLQDPDANLADPDDFPMLVEGAAQCGRCAFRGSCGR